ncbi:Aminoacyl carrier protein 1 [Methylobacterium crusticola]|uniref:Aminoacyl carrier protein 1 n=1 Tax=Methylobacterium crusticola TaxID=1697972 RepID=A0ABQ4QQB9_9HYPH|nr:phosphopantetheine-binding protein [Methylobacterium crusticola]GJD47475.1 Aminoacyl carrier protein 1 [Methylobacterium crusticola]
MPETTATDTTGRTAALVQGILEQKGATAQPGPETYLTEAGLTSLDLVNLMLAIEAEFDIMIPSSHLNPQSFRTVATIAAMVDAVRRDASLAA